MKLNHTVLVIGCGFFSQNTYLKILKSFFKKKNIFVFDERINLKKKTAKYFGYKYLSNVNSKELRLKNIQICFLCFDRSKSFVYSKKILKNKIHLFAEKPVCSNSKNLKLLINLAKKSNLVFYGSFQRLFENKIKYIFKILKNKQYKKLKIISSFRSGNFRFNKKTLIRTNEILKIKTTANKDKVGFLIFLNRYWHILNTINYVTNFLKKDFKCKLIKLSLTSYYLIISSKNFFIFMILNSQKKSGWHEMYNINDQKKFYLKAPLNFTKREIYKTSFFKQVKYFINLIKKNCYKDIFNIYEELKFIENLWKKKYIN